VSCVGSFATTAPSNLALASRGSYRIRLSLLRLGFRALAMLLIVLVWWFGYTAQSAQGWALITIIALVWAVFPRLRIPPAAGIRLARDKQPRLFALVEEVAASVGCRRPPRVIHLIMEPNAWVRLPRVALPGARATLGIGLPLFATLSVEQLRGVIAHEMAHLKAGDDSSARRSWQLASALGRVELATDSVVAAAFAPIRRGLRALEESVWEELELEADAEAACLVGPACVAQTLRAVGDLDAACDHYYRTDFMRLVREGMRPPLAVGLAEHFGAPKWRARAELGGRARASLRTGSRRFQALARMPERMARPDRVTPPALSILADVAELERELLRHEGVEVGSLEVVSWADAPRAWERAWRRRVGWASEALGALRFADLEAIARDPEALVTKLPPVADLSADYEGAYVNLVIGSAIALAFLARGWKAKEWQPGEPVALTLEGDVLYPFAVLESLRSGHPSVERWRALCRDLDLDGISLWEACRRSGVTTIEEAADRLATRSA